MDLAQLIQNETADCKLVDIRTGLQSDVSFTVYSKESSRYKEALRAALKEEGELEREVCFYAHMLDGWENVEFNGKKLPFNLENAKTVIRAVSTIRNQLDSFIVETGNFLVKS